MARQSEPQASKAPGAKPERLAAFKLGVSAESRAAALLMIKGFRIVARRWRSPLGEIDLVARRRQLLVFVEVKARGGFDAAVESLTERQRRRIVAAAEAWFTTHAEDAGCDVRFDVVLVAPGRLPRHIPNAFDASV